ncbi:MAG: M48 family metallopeptidase [Planctomycetes bacterium]|nr:M48 family metallopeptidase [Planctomycetota bacterium]
MPQIIIACIAIAALFLASRSIPGLMGKLGRAIGGLRRGIEDPAALLAKHERAIGQMLAARTVARHGADPDPDLARKVRGILLRLDEAARRGPRRPEFPRLSYVLLAGGEPNASAGLGGVITVHRPLIGILGGDDELAAVLAHEVAHIACGHIHARVMTALATRAGTAIASGGRSLIFRKVADAAEGALLAGYSRAVEDEADAEALGILARAGFDPSALIRVLERLAALEGRGGPGLAIFRSHPRPEERIATIRRRLERG